MSRTLHALRMAALLALAVAVLGPAVSAEDEAPATESKVSFQDLDPKLRKDVAIAAHAYFDPTVEFLWRPRKDLKTAFDAVKASTGSDVLANIPLLREIVYQGRHFLSRYDDKKWQREEEISEHKKDGIYLNVKSERWRFTYTLPSSYPKERALEKIPRAGTEPLPLLLSIHEARDVKDARKRAEKYPGGAVLKRRYPKGDFGALYDNWLVIAPVAARAKFLEDDGAIRHRFLTQVLTEFWRHYHVDYDRIVVDGGAPAAALAAAFPHVFAGLVLRPGKGMKIEPDVVQNYGGVPVFVVGDKDLAKQLEDAGHTDVTVGSDKDVIVWMNQRERHMPRNFTWSMLRPDHRYANWIDIAVPDYTAPERTLEVEIVDTEEEPNTIKIRARGIEKILLYLNDQIVDLDKDVRLIVNGHKTTYDAIERDFGRLFDKDPNVRRNMNFGWLYPVLLEDIKVRAPDVEEKPAAGDPETPTDGSDSKGTDEAEASAAKLWAKAEAAEKDANKVKARLYYQKIVDIGQTSYLARATAKLEELGE